MDSRAAARGRSGVTATLTREQRDGLRADLPGSRRRVGELRKLDVAEMLATEPPPVPWVVEDFAVKGSLTLLAGREGEGKSLFAMSIAAAVLSGSQIAGMNTERGRVLILDAENGEYEIHRRVNTLGFSGDEGVAVYEADFFHLGRQLDRLNEVLRQEQPDLLVLDSFRSLWPGGEENDSGAVAQVLDPLRNLVRRHRVAAILLHHSPKRSSGYRGSTAIGAAVELGFVLARSEGDPEGSARRYLSCWKCRPAPEPSKRWIHLHAERGQVFIEAADAPLDVDSEPLAGKPAQSKLGPELLRAAEQPSSWPEIARTLSRSPKDGTARRLRDALLESGELEELPDGRLVAAPSDLKGAASAPPSRLTGTAQSRTGKEVAARVPKCQTPKGGGTLALWEPHSVEDAIAGVARLDERATPDRREWADSDPRLLELQAAIDTAPYGLAAAREYYRHAREVYAQ